MADCAQQTKRAEVAPSVAPPNQSPEDRGRLQGKVNLAFQPAGGRCDSALDEDRERAAAVLQQMMALQSPGATSIGGSIIGSVVLRNSESIAKVIKYVMVDKFTSFLKTLLNGKAPAGTPHTVDLRSLDLGHEALKVPLNVVVSKEPVDWGHLIKVQYPDNPNFHTLRIPNGWNDRILEHHAERFVQKIVTK